MTESGPEANIAMIRRAYAEALSAPDLEGRLAAARRYWAADMVDHSPSEGQAPGIQGILDVIEWITLNRPELTITIDDALADGDRVAIRETWTTAHGRRTVFHWYRIRDGQVVDEWSGDFTHPPADAAAGETVGGDAAG